MYAMAHLLLTMLLLGATQVQAFISAVEHCPQLCHISGPNPTNWTHFNDLTEIRWCEKTTLFDLALHTAVDASDTDITMRACTSSQASGSVLPRLALNRIGARMSPRQDSAESTLVSTTSAKACGASGVKPVSANVPVHLTWSGSRQNGRAADVGSAVGRLLAHAEETANCDATSLFARHGNAIVGVYVGSQIDKKTAANLLRGSFTPMIDGNDDGIPKQIAAQVCGNVTSSQIVGVFADTTGDIAAVQQALADWDSAKCIQDYDQQDIVSGEAIGVLPAIELEPVALSARDPSEHDLVRRATCKYLRAQSGDGCWSLAQKCGITQTELVKYNGGSNSLCDNSIIARQPICCGDGDLPDFSPQPKSDGACFDYTVKERDLCSTIAAAHDMPKWEIIEDYNKNTWGWTGCKNLQVGQRFCLSKGDPPMPGSISNARCGPQVPGTQRPTNGTKLQDLNPCPLNVCCNIHGQCGLTSDFCVEAPADTGAPGAAKPGSNGCISNCGSRIVNNAEAPAQFISIGYFEAWNMDRRCQHMDISSMNNLRVTPPTGSGYTHVHFAFPNITWNLEVDVSNFTKQFDGLKKLNTFITNKKRIISFGGWAFSNDAPTYQILRFAVSTEANRQKLARNVVNFVNEHGLDGVDFDWEYPGASDIPGTPGGSPTEGADYLKLLKAVRSLLPSNKSLSIAAPASFWYLQNFPIKDMAEVLDYIVYMTYDLHGQWDAGNKWASPGCPEGNCLRHHVNMTETMQALSMITKAGVPAKKVIVGMPYYGRSFKMSSAGCTGPMCTFTGDRNNSQAAKGPCTNTAGYISNLEIAEIMSDPVFNPRTIEDKEGDILIYSDTEYVGYLSSVNYVRRAIRWAGLNFGGTVDWAVDLAYDFGKDGKGPVGQTGMKEIDPVCDFSVEYSDLADLESKSKDLPLLCKQVGTLQVFDKMLGDLSPKYHEVNKGYDEKFQSYVKYTNNMIPGAIDGKMWELKGRKFAKGFDYFECTRKAANGRITGGPAACNKMPRDDIALGGYYMHLRMTDKEGFLKFIAEAGIPEEWITFDETVEFDEECHLPAGPNPSCPTTSGHKRYVGYPKKKSSVNVPNPKDIVTSGIGNVDELRNMTIAHRLEISLGIYDGNPDDVIQVISVPVFLLEQAIEGMGKAKELADKQEEMDRDAQKNLILTIVGAVLFIVPFAGAGGAAALGATSLARVLLIIGKAANIAYTVYGVVDDPDSALMAVMGLLMGAAGATRGPRTPAGFKDMATKRAKLTSTASLGSGFKTRDDTLQRIITTTCKR